nr:flagellar type III secretion system pore protein FliP [Pseudooceanicola algae]
MPLFCLVLLPLPGWTQDVSVNIADDGSLSARGIQLILLITVLSVAPGILVTITCFPFLVTTLSILRQAIGLQQSPPNMLIVSLAMFLTYFIMEPVFQQAWSDGVQPFVDEQIALEEAFPLTIAPFRGFMANRMNLETFEAMAALRPDAAQIETGPGAPLSVLVPSFMLSEIARAFQIGFLLYLPFLIIDLVVAAVLMSMGMMMVPPAIVSLPFKLAFFVVADGWSLVSSSLVRSYF